VKYRYSICNFSRRRNPSDEARRACKEMSPLFRG
jgi:hypothetical protein